MMRRLFILLFGILFAGCAAAGATAAYPPNRWLVDLDRYPIQKPKTSRAYKYVDIADLQILYRVSQAGNVPDKTHNALYRLGLANRKEALNVSSFDEVANSTWFTNRVGRHALSRQEIVRGPNTGPGPDLQGPWMILSAKTEGLTPGFLIEDARGDKYFIKFDPPGHPELASGAEVISTKLFHAFGYNVPENYVVTFKKEILKISPAATTRGRYGRKIPFQDSDFEEILSQVERDNKGRYRALASKMLPGEALGPFAFEGRRSGDKNDRIPHQHRRELRGYQVFAALTHHGDSRTANTLDMYLPEEKYVKHYLIDFGGTIGSAGVGPKGRNHLYDHRMNYARTMLAAGMLGFYHPYWEDAAPTGDLSVGVFESDLFKPQSWKPTYLNPTFRRMSPRDGFWGAKIVMKLSDEAIAGIVREARYSNPANTEYVSRILRQRRDKIGAYWFKRVNPLDDFNLSGNRIQFRDLAVDHNIAAADQTRYRYRWRTLKGGAPLTEWKYTTHPQIDLKTAPLLPDKTYLLRIQTKRGGGSPWSPAVDLMMDTGDTLALIGLKRRY